MESFSLMLLSMLVLCLLIINHETILVSGRRHDGKLWSNRMALEDRSSTFSRHKTIKYVDAHDKLATARSKPNLIDLLGNSRHYQDIEFSTNQQPNIKLADGNAPSEEKPSKPFWGPPIVTLSTEKPTYYARPMTRTFKAKDESSVYHQSNNRDHSTLDPKFVDKKKQNPQNEKLTSPEDILEQPIHMQSGPPYLQENELHGPIDQSLWHRVPVTEPTTFINNPISPQSYFYQKHQEGEIVNKDPHYSGILEAPVPAAILKDIDSSALASYPAPYYPASSPDHHIVYHHQTPAHNNYYHPPSGFAQVDFSPIFLAIVPIALFLGAAAAFALATATSSNSAAVAVAQQQQQEESSNNNVANNNNANNHNNVILAALLEVIQTKHDDSHVKHKIILITTTTAATTTIPGPGPTIISPPPPPTLFPFITAKDVPPFERFANQSVSIPPDRPISEEDELDGGFDLPGGGTVIDPPILEEEEPDILTYDL